MRRAACVLALAASAAPAFAHRLDEYLQLSVLSVEPGRIRTTIHLTPGVAVAKRVIALMDANGDGALSMAEKRAYAARVVGDLTLRVDGRPLTFRLVDVRFPALDAMRRGVGEIRLDLDAPVPKAAGVHTLAFENRHLRPLAAYLVECLAPFDPTFRAIAQNRSREQERYLLRYTQGVARRS